MSAKSVLLFVVLSYTYHTALAKTSVVGCYFLNWSIDRGGNGTYEAANINVNLCTHIFYAYAGVTEYGDFQLIREWNDIHRHQIEEIVALKKKKKDLKILVTIGQYHTSDATFSALVANASARANFISTSFGAIERYGFDGLDLIWLYPNSSNKENFAKLLQEMKTTFSANNLLLTIGVIPRNGGVDEGYDVPVLSKTLDMIKLMAHDFPSTNTMHTGSNAPLYYSPDEMPRNPNINDFVNSWLSQGANPQKLVLGVPFSGRSFTLVDESDHGLRANTRLEGPYGPYTRQPGFIGYNEMCELTAGGAKYTRVWLDVQKVPYFYIRDSWISCEDEISMKAKVEYAKEKNLLGVSVYDLGIDDFRGQCGKPHGLLSVINQTLASSSG